MFASRQLTVTEMVFILVAGELSVIAVVREKLVPPMLIVAAEEGKLVELILA